MTRILQFAGETAEVVSMLAGSRHWMQGLVILYSAIDTLAWANKDEGDVGPEDFIRWVAGYVRPAESLGCTPEDLYGARCALVHSSSAESRMS